MLPVRILRLKSPDYPGFVECAFSDAAGVEHKFVDKVPVVSLEDLDASSAYPCAGQVACEVEEQWRSDDGQTLARIRTDKPWGIESLTGQSQFVVALGALVA